MAKIIDHLKRLDWILAASAAALAGMGIVSLYGYPSAGTISNFEKQIIFLGLGLILMVLFSFFDWRIFRENSILILLLYFSGILLLLGLFFFAPELRDVRRWYVIGPVSFDPVEFFKIIMIILLAKYFSGRHVEMYNALHIILSGAYAMVPAAITFFQPDMGSALIFAVIWIGILLVSGIKTKHLIILCMVGFLVLALSWNFLLKDYQKARIGGFLEPRIDPQGINWNPDQAKIAIGSGGLFGQGIGAGSQTRYGFLPEAQTDFMFAAIAEEMGIVGVSVLLALFLLIAARIMRIAVMARDNFSKLFCSGFAILIISQAFINIAMNQGMLPIVGLPLPFVSYGGSSLVFAFIGLGFVQGIGAGIDKFWIESKLIEAR